MLLWYFGHYHDYRQVNSQFVLLYEDIVPLELLKYTGREDVNKIPLVRILKMKCNMNKNHNFKVDVSKPLEEQNVF